MIDERESKALQVGALGTPGRRWPRGLPVVARLGLVAFISLGCQETTTAPKASELHADAARLYVLAGEDPVPQSLEEVELAVLEERPVRASGLLQQGILGSAKRYRERVHAVPLRTSEGRDLRRRFGEVLAARDQALERYAAILANGQGADELALLGAIREQRQIELALSGLLAEMDGLRAQGP